MEIRISPPIPIGSVKNLVYLSNEEMATLRRLNAYMPDISVMIESGVFDFKRGRALLHRDGEGRMRRIEIELVKWNE